MEAISLATASGPSKRGRASSSSGSQQVVSCVVDGCKSDLSKCRDYHRRHKVCEMHSKTPCVTIRGLQQRFCQQCSRFHSLEEFDEGKRSCRKRLEGHNRRRRKPQPEPMPVNPSNFLSTTQGSRYLPINNQPTSSMVSSAKTWPEVLKSESNSTHYNSSYSHAYKGRQFPFLQAPDSPFGAGSSSSIGLTFHHNNDHEMLCNGLNHVMGSESGRALSLLSSSSSTEVSDMGLGRVMEHNPMGSVRPIISGLHYHNIGPYHANQGVEGQLGFQQGRVDDGSSPSEGHQTLSFSWE